MVNRILTGALTSLTLTAGAMAAPNVLLITADDLNCSSVGAYGGKVEGLTPHIDSIAEGGIRFNHSHVNIAVCQPSRYVWMTGRYPHNSGGEAFYRLKKKNVPILPDLMRKGGYNVGILGKLGHSTPYKEFSWDMQFDMFDLGAGRSPKIYAEKAKAFVEKAKKEGKPFFLMANSHDPHRPFYGNDPKKWYAKEGAKSGAMKPSKVFKPEDVEVPKFLPDIPDVRLEISEYTNSVKRCDDTVGALLKIIEGAGVADDTLVIFLSDNGMALPFAKTNCYLHSTLTPLVMKWPKGIKAGQVEKTQMVSGIDIAPTIYEATGIKAPEGMDGKSFLPIWKGEKQSGRDRVYTQFYETSARKQFQMRAVQGTKYGYIYNDWSDGKTKFRNESMFGRTFKAMRETGKANPEIQARVELFQLRVPEELYDFSKDPDALNNLANKPEYKELLEKKRNELLKWMEEEKDPILEKFKTYIEKH